jgi:hypothetical protein
VCLACERVRQFGDRNKAAAMPIDPAMLAKSIGTLADLDGSLRWATASDQRAQTLEDNQEVFAAGPCMEAFTSDRPAAMRDATLERRWGGDHPGLCRGPDPLGSERPRRVGRWPDRDPGRLRERAAGLGRQRGDGPADLCRVVASLLRAAAEAQLKGALADQLQTAVDSRADQPQASER